MLTSPLRICQTTGHYFPSGKRRSVENESLCLCFSRIRLDFLVRMARLRLAPDLELGDESLLPDGIQHPEFQPRRAGKGHYVICNKRLPVFDSEPASSLHSRSRSEQRIASIKESSPGGE